MVEKERRPLPTALEIAQRGDPPPWSKIPEIWKNKSRETPQEPNAPREIRNIRREIRHYRAPQTSQRSNIKDVEEGNRRNKILKVAGLLTTSAGLLTGTVTTLLSALHHAEGSLTWALSHGHLSLPIALFTSSVVAAGLAISAIKKH